mmetsp:Transcript_15210/g.20079  ORF Transcript_15210/g.20079 Transcript_15210/m.20079 type:complete len:271 (-) Transcript_15210:134-946(-)|eukprot:CAMPEP_0117753352 /NCGR_PEP_ID=MMETSP0947-20121206/12170_1 /TAXON_ID=44440 /ORGANISM="Chattonella subsalsa, Strain CCMP2191" /LENGTH=270 /DNA_ID=CAMNT_0005572209 /DNA_START=124 /DNA_END=936 /DNA_ORIENTATION=+
MKHSLACLLLVFGLSSAFVPPLTPVTERSKSLFRHTKADFSLRANPNDDDDFFFDDDEYLPKRMSSNRRYSTEPPQQTPPPPQPQPEGPQIRGAVTRALLAGAFIFGVGTGVTVDSAINTNPYDLASRDAIDRSAPNPNICQKYGSSAIAMDSRVFMTFNPFSVYVAQSDVKPACVLRSSNWNVLEREKLITPEEVNFCKNSMNTWAFVGNLEDKPQISCVYQSDDAQNEFLSDPKIGIGEDIYDQEMEASKYLKNPINRFLNDIPIPGN